MLTFTNLPSLVAAIKAVRKAKTSIGKRKNDYVMRVSFVGCNSLG